MGYAVAVTLFMGFTLAWVVALPLGDSFGPGPGPLRRNLRLAFYGAAAVLFAVIATRVVVLTVAARATLSAAHLNSLAHWIKVAAFLVTEFIFVRFMTPQVVAGAPLREQIKQALPDPATKPPWLRALMAFTFLAVMCVLAVLLVEFHRIHSGWPLASSSASFCFWELWVSCSRGRGGAVSGPSTLERTG